ncbi:MAG: hypothetical protein E3K32_03015 [wastewater metagenome]|nr:hypothetical protein [Candidatus Loosdrechtia aerotolerans]
MSIKGLFIIVVLGCIFSGSFSAANTLSYIPHGSMKERLEEGIGYTEHTIDIYMHNFAALNITEELEGARNRGVRVRAVILEHITKGSQRGLLAEILISRGFDVRILKSQHSNKSVQDFILLDDRVLVTGVYNWLAYRNRDIYNDITFYYNSDRIHDYKNIFYQLFTDGEAVPLFVERKEQDTESASPLAGMISDRDKEQTEREYVPGKEPEVTGETVGPSEAISKDFISISFEELDRQFGKESGLSRSEKNTLWKKYQGKYIRWQGTISYRGMGRVDWNRIGVSQKGDKGAEVEILFDWRRFGKVMSLKEGNPVTYTGKLVSYPRIKAPYRLNDGDIEKP